MKRILTVGWMVLLVLSAGCAKNQYRQNNPEAYYETAQKALRDKKCYQARELFRNMLSDFPGSHLTDDAQFGLGLASQCEKDYVTAVFEFERLLNEYPVSPHAAEARFQIGECYYQEARDIHHDQAETLKAIREYSRFIEDYPLSDLAQQAEGRVRELRNRLASKDVMIAQNYLKWGYYTSAQLYAESVLNQYPEADVALDARFVLAQVKAKNGELEKALNDLTLLAGQDLPPKLKKNVIDEVADVQDALAKQQSEK